MAKWRQWYVDDKAIPPEMNVRLNRCHACRIAFRRDPDALCSIHRDELRKYADSRPPPPPEMRHGAVRTHWSVDMSEARKEVW